MYWSGQRTVQSKKEFFFGGGGGGGGGGGVGISADIANLNATLVWSTNGRNN